MRFLTLTPSRLLLGLLACDPLLRWLAGGASRNLRGGRMTAVAALKDRMAANARTPRWSVESKSGEGDWFDLTRSMPDASKRRDSAIALSTLRRR